MLRSLFLLLALLVSMQTGCALGRRTLPLEIPKLDVVPTTRGNISVSPVQDQRRFQNKPSDPSVPSIDGDVNTLTAAQRNGMIARQRGGFGMAAGDVALPASQNVNRVTQNLVEEALKHHGYSLGSGGAA